jgi:nicotinate-nucleotide pyrophosphorylase
MGVTSVIAHIKIGKMHAALESKVMVVSAQGQHHRYHASDCCFVADYHCATSKNKSIEAIGLLKGI